MRQGKPTSGERIVKDIKRQTRKQYSAEEKIRIVLDGLRGEESIAELCRKEGIAQGLYYKWSKDFLEAGKKRLAGDIVRQATSTEVTALKAEAGVTGADAHRYGVEVYEGMERTEADVDEALGWLQDRVWPEWEECALTFEEIDHIIETTRASIESRKVQEVFDQLPVPAEPEGFDRELGELAVKYDLKAEMDDQVYRYATPWIKRVMDMVRKEDANAPYAAQVAPAIGILTMLSQRRFYAYTNHKPLWLSLHFALLMQSGGGKEVIKQMLEKMIKGMAALRESDPDTWFPIATYTQDEWKQGVHEQRYDDTHFVSHRPLTALDIADLEQEQVDIVAEMDRLNNLEEREKYKSEIATMGKQLKAIDAKLNNQTVLQCPVKFLARKPDGLTGEEGLKSAFRMKAVTLMRVDEVGDLMKALLSDGGSNNPSASPLVRQTYYAKEIDGKMYAESSGRELDPTVYSPAFSIWGVATPEKYRKAFGPADREDGTMNRLNIASAEVDVDYDENVWGSTQLSEMGQAFEHVPDDISQGGLQIMYWGESCGEDLFGLYRNTLEIWMYPFKDNRAYRKRIRRRASDVPAIVKFMQEEVAPIDRRRYKQFEEDPVVQDAVARVTEQVHRVAHLAAVSEVATMDMSTQNGVMPECTLQHYQFAWAVVEPTASVLLDMVTDMQTITDKNVLRAKKAYATAVIKGLFGVEDGATPSKKMRGRLNSSVGGNMKSISDEQLQGDEQFLIYIGTSTITEQGFRDRVGGRLKIDGQSWGKAKRLMEETGEIYGAHVETKSTSKRVTDYFTFMDVSQMALAMYRGEQELDRDAIMSLVR